MSDDPSPKGVKDENRKSTHLQTLTTEKLTLARTVSSSAYPPTPESTNHALPKGNSLDDLLAALDAGDDEEQPVEEEISALGASKKIPDEYLHTDLTTGLYELEITQRRREYGWNQMREENRSHIKRFLMFFVGPIQFVMEVNLAEASYCFFTQLILTSIGSNDSSSCLERLGRFGRHHWPPAAQRRRRIRSRLPGWKYCSSQSVFTAQYPNNFPGSQPFHRLT